MKILWVVNIMLPEIASSLNRESSVREGWLTGILNEMDVNSTEYELAIAYPTKDTTVKESTIRNNIKCYPFYEDLDHPELYDDRIEAPAKRIIDKEKPDIVHIYGTEFPHALSFVRAFNDSKHTIITIQGVCSRIAKDYMALLPKKVINSVTFRDIIRRDTLKMQMRKFEIRGFNETCAIEESGNVIGRTFFDKRAVCRINGRVNYFKVNETMRKSFYEGRWKNENAFPHSIFIGQGDYPIKGLHFLLEAAGELLSDYPDLTIRIAGNSIIRHDTFKDKLKTPAYGKYLRELISRYGLEDHIKVLGTISEKEIKDEYLKAALFVCASYVENSPNTLAEAMLLGTPVVTSDAGGITDMISYNEGFIFRRGDVLELKEAINMVFRMEDRNDPELLNICNREVMRASLEFNGESNYNDLLDVYRKVMS